MIKLTFALMSEIKDYYKILNVKSSASPGEIKNAYRRLAMKYHPDRNAEDVLAAAVFTDIAEAYKVLSDAEARKQYNYTRYSTAEQEYKKPAETIDVLINRIKQINKNIKASDPFRLNKDALLYSISQTLPADINQLLQTNNNMLTQLLELICEAAKYLSSHQTKQLMEFLQPLYIKHSFLKQNLDEILHQQQKQERWEKNKIILAVIVAILLCIIIFFAAGK
jgi:molecular chaperone DnaJ